MIRNIPITKARINLGALVRDVYLKNDVYILHKDKIPVAALISIKELKKTKNKKSR